MYKNNSKLLISIFPPLNFKQHVQIISIPLSLYRFVFWSSRKLSARRGGSLHRTVHGYTAIHHWEEGKGADRRHAPRIFHCSVKSEARCATRRAVLSRALVPTVSLYIRDSTGISQVTWNPCATGGGGGGGRRRFVCSRGQKKSCDWSRLLFEKFFVLIFRNSFSSFLFFSTNINARKRIVSFFLENLRFFT